MFRSKHAAQAERDTISANLQITEVAKNNGGCESDHRKTV